MSTANPLPLDAAARDELRAKAEAALDAIQAWENGPANGFGAIDRLNDMEDARGKFEQAATPDVILALLAAVERGAEDTARLTEEVRELRSAGGMLSNCAFNLSQWPTLDPRTAETLNATYRNWDRVVERHVQRAATPTGADHAE